MKRTLCAIAALCLAPGLALAQSADGDVPALPRTADMASPVPIPPAEKSLPTITAKEWFKVSDEGMQLEGPVFTPDGDLIFCEVFEGRIFRLTPEGELSEVLGKNELRPAGIESDKEGNLYVAELGNFDDEGSVVKVAADGSSVEEIVPRSAGYLADDLVFDRDGGFYFTDFKGGSTRPDGGVYYVGPERGEPVQVVPNVAIGNGIGLSPDGKTLWFTELAAGRLHKVSLADATTVAPFGAVVAYQFTGPAPDSLRTDAEGNVYVAMYTQGRIMVFNKNGFPVGQILVPGRDEGHNLRTTSMVIKPGTDDMYIFTNDWDGGEGSTIFHAKALAPASTPYAWQD